MKVTYNTTYQGSTFYIDVDEPSECPICKHSLKPTILHKQLLMDANEILNLYTMYLCTHCYQPFICQFTDLQEVNLHKFEAVTLALIAPKSYKRKTFEECINSLSPDFVEIYNQALKAEHLNLDQIAGIGYRKALEFLIKDFLIIHEKEDAKKVKSTVLGCCINTMLDNPQLKIAASRATWLGNDHTHYEQKYQDKDIKDLKRMIDLSVHWITMIYLTDEAESIEKK